MIETGSLEVMTDALLSTTAAILVGAALLEAVIPWPSHLRLSAVTPLLTRLGHKVHRADGTPRQQLQAGMLAMLVVWVPCAAGLWSLRNLALSEPIFDLLFLLLMIESRPLRELAHATPLARHAGDPTAGEIAGGSLAQNVKPANFLPWALSKQQPKAAPCVWSANGLARCWGTPSPGYKAPCYGG